jgi:hypothetical protein
MLCNLHETAGADLQYVPQSPQHIATRYLCKSQHPSVHTTKYRTYTPHHYNPPAQSASDQSYCRTKPYPRSYHTQAKCVRARPLGQKTAQPKSTRNLSPVSLREAEVKVGSSLTFHRVTCLPLKLSRVAAELVVCAEDERDVG